MKKLFVILIFYSLVIACTGNNPIAPTEQESINGSPPVAGDGGTISFTKIGLTSIEIQWQPASDDSTSAGKLQYKVYYSSLENISNPAQAEQNGHIALDWTYNITTFNITGLTEDTRYYINVIVMDKDGNKAAYKTVNESTKLSPDETTPVAAAISVATAGFTTVKIDWTTATDNRTANENLQYKLVYSTTPANINTKELADANGTTSLNWSKNVYTKTVENLNCSTTYYFALLVKDEAGNMSLYNNVTAKTKDFETKIYFQNGMWSYYITDIEARYSTTDAWAVLRTGYPYVNPSQDGTYPTTTPQYTIKKSSYWFRYKVVSHDWATKQITDLQPGKIYRILFYDNTFSYYVLQAVGSY